jgi:hypothetical protein
MADKKISALPASTTPLAGTEVLPIVQSSTTKQVSVANLTAGRTQTSNGVVQGTAGTGYNFTANTPAAGMTSQLLNWYEEGTWTPNQGAGLVVVGGFSSNGKYVRIGNQVTVSGLVSGATSIATTAASFITTNLPFSSSTYCTGTAVNGNINASVGMVSTGTSIYAAGSLGASPYIFFSLTYNI